MEDITRKYQNMVNNTDPLPQNIIDKAVINGNLLNMTDLNSDNLNITQRRTRDEYLSYHRSTILQYDGEQIDTGDNFNMVSSHGYNVKIDKMNTDVSKLKQIAVKDLNLNQTHKGNYMILKIVERPVIMNSSTFLAEDHTGEILRCAVYNLILSRKEIINKFVIGRYVVIIEPFYNIFIDKWDGLRIDNPEENFVFNTKEQALQFTSAGKKDSTELKNEGNKFMSESNYTAAISKYKQAIDVDQNNHILYSNLAEAHLKLEQNYLAQEAINKSLEFEPKYTKSLFRKTRALYGLNKFEEAISYCNMLLDIKDMPTDELKKIKARSQIKLDNTNGKYNFYQMYLDAQKDFYIDYADYINPKVAYKHTKEKGLLVYAKEKIKQGELISAHKALSCLKKDNNIGLGVGKKVIQSLVNKLTKREDEFKDFFLLFDGTNGSKDLNERLTDNTVTAERVINAYKCNSFTTINSICAPKNIATGLWTFPSFLNHDCLSNTFYYGIGDFFIIVATTDIEPNNEITNNYVGTDYFKYENRRNKIIKNWNFECQCDLCKYEEKQANNKERNFVFEIFEDFYSSPDKVLERVCELNKKHGLRYLMDYLQENRKKFNNLDMYKCLYYYSVVINNLNPFLALECLEKAYSFCRNIIFEIQALELLKAYSLQLSDMDKFRVYEERLLEKMRLMHHSDEYIKEILKDETW
jgi:hypothetical protein